MEFETIETDRLLLRKFTPEIIRHIFANFPEQEIRELMGITTDEEFLLQKKKNEGGYTTYRSTMVQFRIFDKVSEQVLGTSGFHNWYAEHSRAEIGYNLLKDEYKRKGFMSEAVKAILDYGFGQMHLHRIEAYIAPYNEASLALIRKYGFTQEACLKEHYFYDGKMDDSLIFALLKREYELKHFNKSQ